MANQKETLSTINDLIETLKDGQKGFQEAADAVDDPQLKSLFTGYSQQRARFASELQTQARSVGEPEPETGGSATGAMHRDVVSRQYSEIKSAHDRIKNLRDAAKKAA
jgi:hypothetical protein